MPCVAGVLWGPGAQSHGHLSRALQEGLLWTGCPPVALEPPSLLAGQWEERTLGLLGCEDGPDHRGALPCRVGPGAGFALRGLQAALGVWRLWRGLGGALAWSEAGLGVLVLGPLEGAGQGQRPPVPCPGPPGRNYKVTCQSLPPVPGWEVLERPGCNLSLAAASARRAAHPTSWAREASCCSFGVCGPLGAFRRVPGLGQDGPFVRKSQGNSAGGRQLGGRGRRGSPGGG